MLYLCLEPSTLLLLTVFYLETDSLKRVMRVEEKYENVQIPNPHTTSTLAASRFYAQRNMYEHAAVLISFILMAGATRLTCGIYSLSLLHSQTIGI